MAIHRWKIDKHVLLKGTGSVNGCGMNPPYSVIIGGKQGLMFAQGPELAGCRGLWVATDQRRAVPCIFAASSSGRLEWRYCRSLNEIGLSLVELTDWVKQVKGHLGEQCKVLELSWNDR